MRYGSTLIDLALTSLSKSAQYLPHAKKLREGIQVWRDIPYLATGNRAHCLDIYAPQDAKGSLPVVMYVHGGGFRVLSKDTHWMMAYRLAQAGYLVVNVNYRLAPKDPFPAALEDVAAAYVWMSQNAQSYGGDLSRLTLMGESAGANLITSLTLATCFDRLETFCQKVFATGLVPRAVIPACGLLEVHRGERFSSLPGRRLPWWVRDRIRVVCESYLRGTQARCDARLLELVDPVVVLESQVLPVRDLPTFFIPVGMLDPILQDSRRLEQALLKREVPCYARYYADVGHAFFVMIWKPEAKQYWKDVFAFLDTTLSLPRLSRVDPPPLS